MLALAALANAGAGVAASTVVLAALTMIQRLRAPT